MADTILGGDFTVTYLAENRQKRLEWTGSATGTRTANEVYSALQSLMDDVNQMDDGSVMSAQTPTEYTIGKIDPNDAEPWFVDRTTIEHITGGAIKTAGWKRVVGTSVGLVKMGYAQTVALLPSDIGKKIVMTTDGDSGTLLDFNATTLEMWIRPDSNAVANSFDNTPTANGAWTITGGTGTGTQAGGTSLTGDSLFANIFTLGTQESNTHMYVLQNGTLVTSYKGTTDWWVDGAIDILLAVKEVDVEIDAGVITVFARQTSKSGDHFETDLTAGGRNPIPLATADDLDNTSGDRQMVLTTAAGGPFVVDEVIQDDTDASIQGVVTKVAGSNPNVTLDYYLIGDPLTDFGAGTGSFTGQTSSATGTAVAPSTVGPGISNGVTVTHGVNETFDIDENGTTENFSIVVNCNNRPLTEVYERLKFLIRRGEVSTTDTDGVQGQFYIGSDTRISYTTLVGTVAEGAVVTQVTTLATGTVVAHNTTDNYLILRNSRGSFNNTDNVEVDASNRVTGPTSTVIAPKKAAPFGTFAGGKFFLARGVVLQNVPAADTNNWQTTDDDNIVRQSPNKVSVTIGNTRSLDALAMFRLDAAGGVIKKDSYLGTVQAAGASSLVVGTPINVDEPGKISGGIVRFVDVSANFEYRLRFSSWATSTFTLSATSGLVADAGTNATTIVDAAGAFNTNAKKGDLIRNVTAGVIGYVISVDSDTQLTTTTMAGQTTADVYDINTLPVALTTSDTVYVPIIDTVEDVGTDGTPGTQAVTVTYVSNIPVRVRVRQAGVMLPYEADATITSTGLTNNAIRTPDPIFT